jgi:hypothetical protein
VRLAELLASLSLATDLGLGLPMEHVLRSCVLALNLADDVGLDESDRAAVYYVALLAWLGCHADSHEQAAWFGDDIALRADAQMVDSAGPELAAFILRRVGTGSPPWRRALRVGSLVLPGPRRDAGDADDALPDRRPVRTAARPRPGGP